jgi:hypothetical protein
MDGKCVEIFWSGHEGGKLTKLTRKTQKKSNIDKQNKKQTKKEKGFKPIGSLTCFAFYAENSANNHIGFDERQSNF